MRIGYLGLFYVISIISPTFRNTFKGVLSPVVRAATSRVSLSRNVWLREEYVFGNLCLISVVLGAHAASLVSPLQDP